MRVGGRGCTWSGKGDPLSLTTMRPWLSGDDMATTRGVELQSNDQTLLQGGCQRLKSF